MGRGTSLPVVADDSPLVTLTDLQVTLGERPVLTGVSADIPRGKVTAVVGLNGCGKTTLLRCLVGDYAYAGRVTFRCGHDHTRPAPEHVGYVPQRLALDARLPLTVKDFLALALSRRPLFLGVSRHTVERIRSALERVGMTPFVDAPMDGLSGGQVQRVLLALALEPKPELLLLDEPAAGIDFRDQAGFYDRIGGINRDTGVTVVVVSHDLDMVRRHADKVVGLRGGRVVCDGPPGDVLTPANVTKTFGAAPV